MSVTLRYLDLYWRDTVRPEPDNVREIILGQGTTVTWEIAQLCPCSRVMTGGGYTHQTKQARTDCPACSGSGYLYHSAQQIPVMALHPERNPKRFAGWDLRHLTGALQVTFLPEHTPTEHDRLTCIERVMARKEIRVRTSATVERLDYPVAEFTVETGDPANQAEPVETKLSVLDVRKADLDGVVDPSEVALGTDFEVDAQGRIDWSLGDASGRAPAEGARYSVHYYFHPRYVVRSFPYSDVDMVIDSDAGTRKYVRQRSVAMCWLEWLGDGEGSAGAA